MGESACSPQSDAVVVLNLSADRFEELLQLFSWNAAAGSTQHGDEGLEDNVPSTLGPAPPTIVWRCSPSLCILDFATPKLLGPALQRLTNAGFQTLDLSATETPTGYILPWVAIPLLHTRSTAEGAVSGKRRSQAEEFYSGLGDDLRHRVLLLSDENDLSKLRRIANTGTECLGSYVAQAVAIAHCSMRPGSDGRLTAASKVLSSLEGRKCGDWALVGTQADGDSSTGVVPEAQSDATLRQLENYRLRVTGATSHADCTKLQRFLLKRLVMDEVMRAASATLKQYSAPLMVAMYWRTLKSGSNKPESVEPPRRREIELRDRSYQEESQDGTTNRCNQRWKTLPSPKSADALPRINPFSQQLFGPRGASPFGELGYVTQRQPQHPDLMQRRKTEVSRRPPAENIDVSWRGPLSTEENWKEVLFRLEFLVDSSPTGEVHLPELPDLYMSQFQASLNIQELGFPDLKSLLIASPTLCLVWMYNPPLDPTVGCLKRQLLMDQMRTTSSTSDSDFSPRSEGPVKSKLLFVRRRKLTVESVAKDVMTAVVAHWVLMHETRKASPEAEMECIGGSGLGHFPLTPAPSLVAPGFPSQEGERRRFELSRVFRQLSTVGMPLSLLARTWDANWADLCTLELLLRRTNASSLEALVRQIPAFEVTQNLEAAVPPRGALGGYQESSIVIFLKRASRIPIVPELVPDPSASFYDTPNAERSPLVFFPPFDAASVSAMSQRDQQALGQSIAAQVVSQLARNTVSNRQSLAHPPPSRPFSVGQKSDVARIRAQAAEMLFELITACCEWQMVRWLEDEDIVEMREEEVEAADAQKIWRSSDTTNHTSADASRRASTMTAETSNDDQQAHSPDGDLDLKRKLKKEQRDLKRKRRSVVRDWCRFRRSTRGAGTEDVASTLVLAPVSLEQQLEKIVLPGGDGGDLGLSSVEQLKQARQEYRNRSVGVYVSSIKMEWSKYFDEHFPLMYLMEKCHESKLKSLLVEVPNLILTGDGGFMKVCTVEHAKKLCDPYPPVGLQASGVPGVQSVCSPVSADPKFQCATYLDAAPASQREGILTKLEFFRCLSAANAQRCPRPFQLSGLRVKDAGGPHHPPSAAVTKSQKSRLVWELSTEEARETLAALLRDLVVLHSVKQRDLARQSSDLRENGSHGTDSPTRSDRRPSEKSLASKKDDDDDHGDNDEDEVGGTIDSGVPRWEPAEKLDIWEKDLPILSLEQQNLIEFMMGRLNIDGLRIDDLMNRWNATYVKFSPFSLFLKKAGFRGINDPAFKKWITSSLRNDIVVARNSRSNVALFTAVLSRLEDPDLQKPNSVALGTWLKRKSLSYLPGRREGPSGHQNGNRQRRHTSVRIQGWGEGTPRGFVPVSLR